MPKDFDHKNYVKAVSIEFGRREAVRMKDMLSELPFVWDSQSPIETMFGCALAMEMEARRDIWAGVEETAFSRIHGQSLEGLTLAPVQGIYGFYQVRVGDYRVDFMVAVRTLDEGTGYFAAELDGHDFHEKTKEQVARDKARDRFLQSRGIGVLRFSGSEIWNDAEWCAASFLDDCYAALQARAKGAT